MSNKKDLTLPYFDKDGWLRNTHLFGAAGQKKLKTGKYTDYPKNSKGWVDFWTEEKRRCLEGYTLGEITVTGYHYFYLNYYTIPLPYIKPDGSSDKKLGFPKFWFIDWQFFNIIKYCYRNGLHFYAIKVRGCGYSEKFAAMGVCNTMIVDRDTNGNRILRNTFYFGTVDEHLGGDGIYTKFVNGVSWLNNETDGAFKRSFQMQNRPANYEMTAGKKFKDGRTQQTGGSCSGVILKTPDDTRGKRGYLIAFEEAGTNQLLNKAINIAKPLVELDGGKSVTGLIAAWGTSNEKDSKIEGLKKVIYNPQGYRGVKFRNVYNPDGEITEHFLNSIPKNPEEFIIPYGSQEYAEKGTGTGWFVPAYDIRGLDSDGNPSRYIAYQELLKERSMILTGQSEEDAMSYFADNPFTIKEALMKAGAKEFTSNKLSKQIVDIETGMLQPDVKTGNFYFVRDSKNFVTGVSFVEDKNGKFKIREIPKWCYFENGGWQMRTDQTNIQSKLYIAGIDSIDQGVEDSATDNKSKTNHSKLACLVKKRTDPDDSMNIYNSCYVAQYMYRPNDVRESYEDIAMVLVFYNAIGLLEYTKLRIKDYFADNGFLKYLAKEPDSPGTAVKTYVANKKKYGIRATLDIINFYIQLIKEYIEDAYYTIHFKDLLDQLNNYTKEEKTKFDLIAAMGMCEVLGREFSTVLPSSTAPKEVFELPVWYTDSNGIRKFGVNKEKRDTVADSNYYERIFDAKTHKYID